MQIGDPVSLWIPFPGYQFQGIVREKVKGVDGDIYYVVDGLDAYGFQTSLTVTSKAVHTPSTKSEEESLLLIFALFLLRFR